MSWLQKLFSKKKFQEQEQSSGDSRIRDSKMVQVVSEEIIMAVAQWLIAVVNRTLQPKPNPQPPVEEASVASSTAEHEKLLLKLSSLVERLYERDQAMATLEKRLHAIEEYLGENGDLGQYMKAGDQATTTLGNRLDGVEAVAQQIPVSLEKVEQNSQLVTALENRIKLLEILLIRFRVVPRSVGGNSQAIALLKNRVDALESSQNSSQKNGHASRSVAQV